MSSWPILILLLLKALIVSTLLTLHIASSPLFTCLDTPVILRGYSVVSSHVTPFSIHHYPLVIFRVLKIYIYLLPSLVTSQHPATQSSSQPPYTTMLCPWLLQLSEHSCQAFSNENNRPMSPSIFPHLPFSSESKTAENDVSTLLQTVRKQSPSKIMWHLSRSQTSMLWKPETLQNY